MNLFWFAHHTLLMSTLTRLPSTPCLSYGETVDLERQLCEFILRGIGLNETAIASHLDRELSPGRGQPVNCRKCMTMNIVTEANIAGRPIADKSRARPVRMVRWFIIVGALLAAAGGRSRLV